MNAIHAATYRDGHFVTRCGTLGRIAGLNERVTCKRCSRLLELGRKAALRPGSKRA